MPQRRQPSRGIQQPTRLIAELLVMAVERAALLLSAQLQKARIAVEMKRRKAFRGRRQHGHSQGIEANFREHAHQPRQVDLRHASPQNLAPELVRLDHIHDLLA